MNYETEFHGSKPIASVQKALRILTCFDSEHTELSLAQLSKAMDCPKTTTFGLINTLVSEGYLDRCERSVCFRLGTKILELSYFVQQSLPIIHIAAPLLDRSCTHTHKNIYLTTHRNGRLFYLDNCYSDREFTSYSASGKVAPLHCTASGKVMLSYMTADQVLQIIDKVGLAAITANTITDASALLKQLSQIRGTGYALDNEEETIGVRCLAVPILSPSGVPVGALSASGSVSSMPPASFAGITEILLQQSRILSISSNLFPYRFL